MRWVGSLVREGALQLPLCYRYKARPMEKRERLELFKLLHTIRVGPLDEFSAGALVRDPVKGTVRYGDESCEAGPGRAFNQHDLGEPAAAMFQFGGHRLQEGFKAEGEFSIRK